MDPRTLQAAARLIEKHEGRRHMVYLDSEGHPTVGVGFNLDRPGAPQTLSRVGASHVAVLAGAQGLSDAQIDALLADDVVYSMESARVACPQFNELHQEARLALIDMAFNLGLGRLATFRAMLAAIARGDLLSAAIEALDSKWARQVGRRAFEDAALLLCGYKPEV